MVTVPAIAADVEVIEVAGVVVVSVAAVGLTAVGQSAPSLGLEAPAAPALVIRVAVGLVAASWVALIS